tara:strand:+ start:404 stop:553 length:150 start_codon:yes stop_codon:yes gene_type:complete
MATNHDDEYYTEYSWPKDKYWQEVTSFKPCVPESWQAAADDYELSEDVI